ncbi:alpha/beta fold hydrolase, partial [Variovorax sp. Root411]|uniref:alpha/beta fold hydrolase n=1 Tax=Variovorax sp. Root411 TaxID=1736530 RepID=UPI0039E12FB4
PRMARGVRSASTRHRHHALNHPAVNHGLERTITDDVHAMTEILAKEVRGARKVVLPGVGHMSNMEAPEEVNVLLLKFLAT